MKLTTLLLIGTAALATPALAQATATPAPGANEATNANADTKAQGTISGNTAGAAADTSANSSTQAAANTSMSNSQASAGMSANTQTAANSSGSADTSPLSSVPDTQKKYKRASRASDFRKEAETTKQLNQQVASAGGLPKIQ